MKANGGVGINVLLLNMGIFHEVSSPCRPPVFGCRYPDPDLSAELRYQLLRIKQRLQRLRCRCRHFRLSHLVVLPFMSYCCAHFRLLIVGICSELVNMFYCVENTWLNFNSY